MTYKVVEKRGAREQYIDGLNDVISLLRVTSEPVVLHIDQRSVYASIAYNELIKKTNVIRSMSGQESLLSRERGSERLDKRRIDNRLWNRKV